MVIFMELKMVSEHVGFLTTRVKVGVLADRDRCILVDSGLDSGTAKKILSLLGREGYSVVGVINTHSHADHCGGSSYIKSRTGAKVYASALEAAIIENPSLEPIYFAGGANPPQELRNKFMMGEACKVDQIIKEGKLESYPLKVDIISLPGHSPQQLGVLAENTFFCADSVFPLEVLEKHRIVFLHNVHDALESLKRLLTVDCEYFLPSHGELLKRDELEKLVSLNLEAIEMVEKTILENLDSPLEICELVAKVLNHHNLGIESYSDYHLYSSTIKAYLSYLQEKDLIEFKVKNNRPLVSKKPFPPEQ